METRVNRGCRRNPGKLRIGINCLIGLFLTGISACGKHAQVVEFGAVVANPAAYSGKTIQIEGAAVVQFERSFICEDPDAVDSPSSRACIWLSGNYEVPRLDHVSLERFDKKVVRVTGLFTTERRGHLGQYVGEMTPTEVLALGAHSAGGVELK